MLTDTPSRQVTLSSQHFWSNVIFVSEAPFGPFFFFFFFFPLLSFIQWRTEYWSLLLFLFIAGQKKLQQTPVGGKPIERAIWRGLGLSSLLGRVYQKSSVGSTGPS
jgi:hypothetical protein